MWGAVALCCTVAGAQPGPAPWAEMREDLARFNAALADSTSSLDGFLDEFAGRRVDQRALHPAGVPRLLRGNPGGVRQVHVRRGARGLRRPPRRAPAGEISHLLGFRSRRLAPRGADDLPPPGGDRRARQPRSRGGDRSRGRVRPGAAHPYPEAAGRGAGLAARRRRDRRPERQRSCCGAVSKRSWKRSTPCRYWRRTCGNGRTSSSRISRPPSPAACPRAGPGETRTATSPSRTRCSRPGISASSRPGIPAARSSSSRSRTGIPGSTRS